MSKQNIYDQESFFEDYKELRKNTNNANSLFETPALLKLMPALNGKSILDLGCGFGEHCQTYAEMGAERVLGLDISDKMLAVARAKNQSTKISYLNLPMEDMD